MDVVGVRPMEEDVVAEELFVHRINLSQLRVVATAVVCLSEVAAQQLTSPSTAAMGPYPWSINGMQMCCRNLHSVVITGEPSMCKGYDVVEGDSEDFDLESEDGYDFEEGDYDDEDEDEDWDADVVSTQA